MLFDSVVVRTGVYVVVTRSCVWCSGGVAVFGGRRSVVWPWWAAFGGVVIEVVFVVYWRRLRLFLW